MFVERPRICAARMLEHKFVSISTRVVSITQISSGALSVLQSTIISKGEFLTLLGVQGTVLNINKDGSFLTVITPYTTHLPI